MRNPANAEYVCPFITGTCVKRSHRMETPYPVCSVYRNGKQICTCPKRLYEADIVGDVIRTCWPGEPPPKPRIAHEVQMKGFGMVDMVIADTDERTSRVNTFVSVELQAVDLTGSVEPAYQALIANQQLEQKCAYGVNWANVRKRYLSQLISKGFFHHHWGSKIVSVIQQSLYDEFRKFAAFDELDPRSPTSNVVFMLYDFQRTTDPISPRSILQFRKAVGTSHNSLMTGSLYRLPPAREAFCEKVLQRLSSTI